MAASLTLQLQYAYTSGSDILNQVSQRVVSAPASDARIDVNVASSTGDATLDTTLVPSIGYVVIVNNDATDSILLGSNGTLYDTKIKAGGFYAGFWNSAAIHYKSSANTPRLRVLVWSA